MPEATTLPVGAQLPVGAGPVKEGGSGPARTTVSAPDSRWRGRQSSDLQPRVMVGSG